MRGSIETTLLREASLLLQRFPDVRLDIGEANNISTAVWFMLLHASKSGEQPKVRADLSHIPQERKDAMRMVAIHDGHEVYLNGHTPTFGDVVPLISEPVRQGGSVLLPCHVDPVEGYVGLELQLYPGRVPVDRIVYPSFSVSL